MLNRIDFQNTVASQQHSAIFNRTVPVGSTTSKVGFTGSVHKKLSHFLAILSSFSTQSSEFTKLLSEDRQNLRLKETSLTQRVTQMEVNLKSLLKHQQQSMITMMKEEGKQRLQKISKNTDLATENYKLLGSKYRGIRDRIEALENTMGYYNAQETHL